MLDIRIPIGLLFVILGIVVTIYGFATMGSDIYAISANSNVNLWSGFGMLVFGGVMLITAKITKKKDPQKND